MVKQTAGRDSLGNFAPKFAELNDKEVYADDDTNETHGGMLGMGEPNTAFAQYFIGNSYLKPLTKPGSSVVSIANVTFEPVNDEQYYKLGSE